MNNPYASPASPEPPRPACTLQHATLWDPITVLADPDQWARVRQAIRACQPCPLRADCLTQAVAAKDSGVRGGVLLDDGRPVKPDDKTLKAPKPQKVGREAAECGTNAAYRRHRRNGETCRTCMSASRLYQSIRRVERRRRRAA